LAAELKTRTITFAASSASMMDSAQGTPGPMSRGAIQQRMPRTSSSMHIVSAAALSFEA
jgi:hypothetical protein